MRRVGVTGGRDFNDSKTVTFAVMSHCEPDDVIVSGAARGADTLAEEAAHFFRLEVERHPADWNTHGKAAGFIRNQEMVDSGLDLLIAFPGGRGTADMVARAKKAGIEVVSAEIENGGGE